MLLLLVSTAAILLPLSLGETGCKFINMEVSGKEVPDSMEEDNVAYNKLKPLMGHRYSAEDTEKKFRYNIGICEQAVDGPKYKNVAVLQKNLKPDPQSTRPTEYVIGRYNETQIMSGGDWIMLEYWHGDKYGNHCAAEPRKAVIIIICDENADDQNPRMTIIDENNSKTSDCYYLFELSHKSVCGGKKTTNTSLSVGSIVLIILGSVIALYILLGFLYQRFVLGAKGFEQIPNYSFWQDFGNLQADGCNLICRSMSSRNSAPYKGIGDEQLEEDLDRERDDHLLPM